MLSKNLAKFLAAQKARPLPAERPQQAAAEDAKEDAKDMDEDDDDDDDDANTSVRNPKRRQRSVTNLCLDADLPPALPQGPAVCKPRPPPRRAQSFPACRTQRLAIAVDLLHARHLDPEGPKAALSARELADLAGLRQVDADELEHDLRGNPRIQDYYGTSGEVKFAYRPALSGVVDRVSLVRHLRARCDVDGLYGAGSFQCTLEDEVSDAYVGARRDLHELISQGLVRCLPHRDGSRAVFWDSFAEAYPQFGASVVEPPADVLDLFFATVLPASEADLQAELAALGLPSMMARHKPAFMAKLRKEREEAAAAAAARKKAERQLRLPRDTSRLTNAHMPEIFDTPFPDLNS